MWFYLKSLIDFFVFFVAVITQPAATVHTTTWESSDWRFSPLWGSLKGDSKYTSCPQVKNKRTPMNIVLKSLHDRQQYILLLWLCPCKFSRPQLAQRWHRSVTSLKNVHIWRRLAGETSRLFCLQTWERAEGCCPFNRSIFSKCTPGRWKPKPIYTTGTFYNLVPFAWMNVKLNWLQIIINQVFPTGGKSHRRNDEKFYNHIKSRFNVTVRQH